MPESVPRILRILSQILIFTWVLVPKAEYTTWDCQKFAAAIIVDTFIVFIYPGYRPTNTNPRA